MADLETLDTDGLSFQEQAADPATPATTDWRVYFKSGGLYIIDDAGVVYGPLQNAADHNHTAAAGDGGDLDAPVIDGYAVFNEEAAPATPAAGTVAVYAKSDGKMYAKDDAGTEYGPFGSGIADQGTVTYLDFTTAAAPAAPAAGKIRVYSKTGDDLAQKDSAGTETVFGAGGGGAADDPIADVFGAADTAYEFDSTSLTGLTAMGTPDAENAHTTVPGHYYVKESGSGYSWCGRYAATPSAPFTAIAKLSDVNPVANYNGACMFLGVATPGNMDALIYAFNVSRSLNLERVTPTAFGSSIATGPTNQEPPIYLGIVVNSSTDVDYLWSFGGRVWRYISEARNPGITIGSVGIAVKSENATWSAAAAFDFLRIWNSAKTFPGI